MAKIQVLDKSIAEKIAAGEVVERPASVVKELVENSIDAGAKSITVEIKRGGISYIRVTDNGCGIAREDAQVAFLRHSTSKIKSEEDLESITTLGFRGEALCSIAAVSRTELMSKPINAQSGTRVVVEGGVVIENDEAGCPEGTTIVVKNLFFNTPARMKFMKKDSTEAGYVADVCQKQALSHPDVSIRLIRDMKEVFFTPGDNNLVNAVHSIFGKEYAKAMLDVEYEQNDIKITGIIGNNTLSRPNRNMQIFFVNGRCVINKTLYFALSEAYKNEVMIGKFPVGILNIKINPQLVDVNVHPAKTEIKFQNEANVYDALYWAVKNTLHGGNNALKGFTLPNKSTYEMPTKTVNTVQQVISQKREPLKFDSSNKFKVYQIPKEEIKSVKSDSMVIAESFYKEEKTVEQAPVKEQEVPEEAEYKEVAPVEKEVCIVAESEAVEPIKIIGQLFTTYILAQMGNDFIMLDQHAAHERLKYEELKTKGSSVAQQILMPISVTVSPKEKEIIAENNDFLLNMGFETEDFGENLLLIRTLPSDVNYEEGGDLLIELANILMGDGKGSISERIDKAIYTVACKAAIKANKYLTMNEMEKLYGDIMALEGISTCPHGRPITVKMSKYQIEKMFKRIV